VRRAMATSPPPARQPPARHRPSRCGSHPATLAAKSPFGIPSPYPIPNQGTLFTTHAKKYLPKPSFRHILLS
jgi:hypothetical protein